MKVLLLAGGDSGEREVSLDSGESVHNALKALGHEVLAIDPSTGQNLLTREGHYLGRAAVHTSTGNSITFARQIQTDEFRDVDVVFNALHGGMGENGVIQCLLDLAGMKYTGAGRAASTIAMNKALTKQLASSLGIRTPHWQLYTDVTSEIHAVFDREISENFTPPFVVKPNDSGSTIGLTVVKGMNQLREALATAAQESPNVLIETYVLGRELTVAVLDGEAFPVVEIIPRSGLYDYEAKYTKGKSEYIVPAEIPGQVKSGLQQAAVAIYNCIGGSGLARVDFIFDKDSRYHFLEINTLPGMTKLSLAPMAAGAAGISFDQLIQRLLDSAAGE